MRKLLNLGQKLGIFFVFFCWVNFLEEHNVSFNPELSTPATNIYTLDVTPTIPNNYYTQIKSSIDYSRGLITKQEMFTGEGIISSYELKKTQQINDIWIATETEQRRYELGYEIVSRIEY